MESENISLKSIEEMWKVIESSGIKREVFEKQEPSFAEIRDLYILIKKRKESPNSRPKVKP